MKQSDFKKALEERLAENQQIFKHPGIGAKLAPVSSAIGLHAFWILLVTSFITTYIIIINSNLSNQLNHVFFGFLYV